MTDSTSEGESEGATDKCAVAAAAVAATGTNRLLPWLIVAQVAMHAAMAGQRMAAPLHALRLGHSALAVGMLLAVFAALPVAVAMAAGRYADRHGYHRPVRVAAVLTSVGSGLACLACALPAQWQFPVLCGAAGFAGAGANVGLITMQRTASLLAADTTERLRVFSWVGMAPAVANVIGPIAAGVVIDAAGFAAAYALMAALPAVSLWATRRMPPQRSRGEAQSPQARRPGASLLRLPGIKRLLFVNWLMSAGWDVHSFAVPLLGHARGFNASTIGLVLGSFTAAVTLVRFAIPLVAQALEPIRVLRVAMLTTSGVFAIYPFAHTAVAMVCCAAVLGLALGAVQPMLMSTLHRLTPAGRHGEAIALRSMAMNASSSLMPLVFGSAGAVAGPAMLFWLVGAAVGIGSQSAPGLRRAVPPMLDDGG